MISKQRWMHRARVSVRLALSVGVAMAYLHVDRSLVAAQTVAFSGPTSSQPLALSADGARLLVANPDNNSVTLFEVANDLNRRIGSTEVGREPNGVAISPDGLQAYVANTVDGTVTVLSLALDSAPAIIGTIPVGTEPYGLALTPNGTKLYVSNARSNTVSVIDTLTHQVIQTVNVRAEPRGLAITNDNDADDTDETVYVTQFLAEPVATGRLDGEDDSKVGLATVLATGTDSIVGTAILAPLAETGFLAFGDAINRVPPGNNAEFTTGAYPNQLNNVAIKGNFAYVPNTGSSPNGPVRFNVNTQSLLHVIDRNTNQDAGQTINMHVAVAQQDNPSRTFITLPWAMAFKHNTTEVYEAYVVSAASNIVVKVLVDPATGAPTVQRDLFDPSSVLQIRVGKNPRGIVINASDTRAYIMNYISRDVTVLDLSQARESVSATLRSADLPAVGSIDDTIHIGKELFNTSIGEFDPPAPGALPIIGRMSDKGWGSCATCHPFGLSDNVVWIFGSGPRRTIPLHADFDASGLNPRVLNWSGVFDEEEDFELNIRNVSGGEGIIVLDDGITPDPDVTPLGPPNANRRQLTVRGVPAWDAIKAYEQSGIRAPIAPLGKDNPDVVAGRALFSQANCQLCHGGEQWTRAIIDFIPPQDPSLIEGGQLISFLQPVGTFDSSVLNEVRANGATSAGEAGFVPPSLLSLFAFSRAFFHNGAVESLDAVMDNVAHRTAGTSGVDFLDSAEPRRQLVQFLLSIDAATVPFN